MEPPVQGSYPSPYIVERRLTREGTQEKELKEGIYSYISHPWIVALTLAREVLSSGTVALTTVAMRTVASFVISCALAPVGT
jgi:hypothetical protein